MMWALAWLAGSVSAEALSPVAAFAVKQEAAIAERVGRETLPRRRLQTEYLMRQDYSLRLEREQQELVRTGSLTTDEMERLRVQRKALVAQLRALDVQLAEAALKAPEIREIQALAEANEARLGALRQALAPASQRKPEDEKK